MTSEPVIVQVLENPIINRVVFEGNKEIEDDVLASEVSLKSRNLFTRSKIKLFSFEIVVENIFSLTDRSRDPIGPVSLSLPVSTTILVSFGMFIGFFPSLDIN